MTQSGLPFSGKTPTSRHCSYLAAQSAAPGRPLKVLQYREYLTRVESATDHETAVALNWPMGTVCSVRNHLVDQGFVRADGLGLSPYGKKVTRWRLR